MTLTEIRVSLRFLPTTIQELDAFHAFSGSATPADWKEGLPQRFLPLLAKLIQDSSVPLTELTSDILEILFPLHYDHTPDLLPEETGIFVPSKPLSSALLSKQILAMAKRENYGVPEEQSGKMAVFRWEVEDLELLPGELTKMLEARRARRAEGRKEALMLVRKPSFKFFFPSLFFSLMVFSFLFFSFIFHSTRS